MASFDIKAMDLPQQVESVKGPEEHAAKDLNNDPRSTITAKEERTCLRKIDTWLTPLIVVTYCLQYVDKVILNGASQFGIIQDLDLYTVAGHNAVTQKPILNLHRFSMVTLIFYWGYLAGALPAAILAQKLPLGKFLAGLAITWGAVTMLTATVSSYPGMLVQRFFLGVCEAGAGPGFSLMIPLFWKREEQPLRYSLWYMSQGLGGFLGPMMVYGIGHIHAELAPWKLQYLILGAITIVWGAIMVFALPNNPESAWFLTEPERKVADARIRLEHVTEETNMIKPHQIVEALKDPKTWLTVVSTYCIHFINGACSGFGSIIVKSFGYSPFKSVLLTGCAGLYLLLGLAVAGVAANYLPKARTVVWCVCEVFVIVGAALIWHVQWAPDHSAALAGFFLLFTFPPSYTMLLSLVGSNTGGYTKKVFVMGLVWMAYCISNGTAPLFIKTTEVDDHYPTLFRGSLITAAISVVCSLAMRFYLVRANKKRDQNLDITVQECDTIYDLTDWENPHYRYAL
ncbi:hypothetical protein PV08_02092 [Exophiala spinifera]|uniref:Major facilitator superfamily (MFS) profile domain-containing protein n=1 Tax=Exophiala spinifera TaxID=91928 RepID=A0A0D2A9V6_9EURO|nr:uncharacterized protein PV08_02092 [Exophiala spinifera]KIW21512.1 hypothetical protein PV08_02092 [Exophiala spinifera]